MVEKTPIYQCFVRKFSTVQIIQIIAPHTRAEDVSQRSATLRAAGFVDDFVDVGWKTET